MDVTWVAGRFGSKKRGCSVHALEKKGETGKTKKGCAGFWVPERKENRKDLISCEFDLTKIQMVFEFKLSICMTISPHTNVQANKCEYLYLMQF